MSENYQLKNFFDERLITAIASDIKKITPSFKNEEFVSSILKKLEPLALKERSQLIADTMKEYLPESYDEAVEVLLKAMPQENYQTEMNGLSSFYFMPIATFVETYGLNNYDSSLVAIYEITKRFTSEFCIRPFIQQYPDKIMPVLHEWTKDENEHVRRLVSEGTRPRLPWASRLPEFQKDPEPVFQLLEKLKEDPSLYVRRSVANNLNDIAKDHPQLVVERLTKWSKIKNEDTQWLIRHAARSLVKSGNKDALSLLGYDPKVKVTLSNFKVEEQVKLGKEIQFSFSIKSNDSKDKNLMVDYAIHFMKANGKQQPKVFKLSKISVQPGQKIDFKKKQSFKPISTRKYYAGKHSVEVLVNGKSLGIKDFNVI